MSDEVPYWPFYCEENLWHLAGDSRFRGRDAHVIVISNPTRRVAMWGQKAAEHPQQPIAWDYHLVLLARAGEAVPGWPAPRWMVWDLDAVAPSPIPAERWLADSFHPALLPPEFAPRFRVVTAEEFRRHLRSDRGHMLEGSGEYKKPPPPWPPIMGEPVAGESGTDEHDGANLERFLDTEDEGFLGRCLDLPGLRAWLTERG